MECWSNGSTLDKKNKTFCFPTQYPIPGSLQAGQGNDDGVFTAFGAPDGDTSPWSEPD